MAVLLLTVAILQTSAMPSLLPWGIRPDLMLLVVVSWSLLRGTREGLVWALGGGLLLDLFSGGPLGAATISLALSNLVISLGGLNIVRSFLWLPLAASTLATAIYDTAYLVILQLSGRPVQWVPNLLQVVVPSMIWNALGMYPIYGCMRWVQQRTSEG